MTEVAVLTDEQVDLVKRTIMPNGSSDDELRLFLNTAQRTGLDPFQRQIYATKAGSRFQIGITIDGFRVVAERTGQMDGQLGPFWCGADGKWVDVWLEPSTPPAAAKIEVFRRGMTHPFTGVALWKEYAAFNSSGQLGYMWGKMPALMLAKCAESLALRKAFPNDLSGLYSEDEMSQAGQVPAEPVAVSEAHAAELEVGALREQADVIEAKPKTTRKKKETPAPEPVRESNIEAAPLPGEIETVAVTDPAFVVEAPVDGNEPDHVARLKAVLAKLERFPEWGEENVLANCRKSFGREILKYEDLSPDEVDRILKVIEDAGYMKEQS